MMSGAIPAAGRREHLSGRRSSMGDGAGGLSGQSFQVGAHFGPFLSGWFPAPAPFGGRFCPDSASGLPYYCQGSWGTSGAVRSLVEIHLSRQTRSRL